MPSRDAELHCPSCSLGTGRGSPSRRVSGRGPGVLAPVPSSVCRGRIRLKLLGWRDISLEGSEPQTVICALQQALLPSPSAAPTAAPAAVRRRRRNAGKGLSFKSIRSTVIRISYHPCHCNGWDGNAGLSKGQISARLEVRRRRRSREAVVALGWCPSASSACLLSLVTTRTSSPLPSLPFPALGLPHFLPQLLIKKRCSWWHGWQQKCSEGMCLADPDHTWQVRGTQTRAAQRTGHCQEGPGVKGRTGRRPAPTSAAAFSLFPQGQAQPQPFWGCSTGARRAHRSQRSRQGSGRGFQAFGNPFCSHYCPKAVFPTGKEKAGSKLTCPGRY